MDMPSPNLPRPTSRRSYEIALICALPFEAAACDALFDCRWPTFDRAKGDSNAYSIGSIGQHNVVLAYMPSMGKASAAGVARGCRSTFPNIKLAVVVGVCGVSPFTPELDSQREEILLGDVIISEGIVQHDLGQQLPATFVRKDRPLESLERPSNEIRAILAKLKAQRKAFSLETAFNLSLLQVQLEHSAQYPGMAKDRLFSATYRHIGDKQSCDEARCSGELVPRSRLKNDGSNLQPAIHFGLVASGDTVMKSGEHRDAIVAREKVIAFEMEGAGVWGTFPCILIKGACDYADSHKSKQWQAYAAATAAACTKAFLTHWESSFSREISLDEISVLLDRAKNQSASARWRLANSDEKLKASDDINKSTQPVIYQLNQALDTNFAGAKSVIASNKDIALELQCEEEAAHETVDKLMMALYAVQKQEEQDDLSKMRSQRDRLQDECNKLQQTAEELKAKHEATEAEVEALEAKVEEAERLRRENENESKGAFATVLSWIVWIARCGSYYRN
ncbi:Nucleoside phosphorylase domain protein [Beauveria brongniartii RCEF 3172]|uniref:Nucleoside phosphorylase domain protein n=1 Tax=Beauveria brongniartii RCEF 3172 TaxID=1081107 RepID=A0A166WN00_9HYPO|nr:Nucleoside phosphorylase domain protein [Beauveria brongniartii RCEF 3172]